MSEKKLEIVGRKPYFSEEEIFRREYCIIINSFFFVHLSQQGKIILALFNVSYHTQTQLRIEEKRKLYTDRLSETLKPQVAAFYKTVSSKSAWTPFAF